MSNYPFVKQSGLKDCGVACLLMVMRYYHGNLPIETLREKTKTGKQGTTAFHLVQTAIDIGMDARGVKCDYDDLRSIPLPCIAHVTINNAYQHYVVIYEIDKKGNVLVADPASTLKRQTKEEFLSIWNHVVIVLYPIHKLPIFKETSYFQFLITTFSFLRFSLFRLFFLSFLITLLSIGLSFYVEKMMNAIASGKESLLFLFAFFLFLSVFKLLCDVIRNIVLITVQQRLDETLTLDLFGKIISLPYSYYHNRTTGEIVSRMSDLSVVKDTLIKFLLTLFIDFPLTLGSFLLLYILNSQLFVIALLLFLGYLLLTLLFSPIFKRKIALEKETNTEAMSYLVEQLQGYETTYALGRQNRIKEKFSLLYDKALQASLSLDMIGQVQYLGKEILHNIGFLVLILAGCLLVFKGHMTVGGLLTFQTLLTYFLGPIRNLMDLDLSLKNAKIALRRVLDLLEPSKENGTLSTISKGDITFYHLSYSYDGYHMILKDIVLDIKKGEKVMISGKSGCGKSTMFQLLLKYYEVNRTQIRIDGVDLGDYNKKAITQNIRYVSQKEFLFTGSIFDNVCLEGEKKESFYKVADFCRLNQIVGQNKLGYHLLLEENGGNLSGGQKQQVILARALAIPFQILILDEATSQMDVDLERVILKDVLSYYKNQTILFISHRFDNLDLFSRWIELGDGYVVKDVSYP